MKPEQLIKYFKQHLDKIDLAMGQFTLIECIGQGGNGLVYEANLLGEVVAIKFLLIEGNGQTKNKKLKRFLAEYFNKKVREEVTPVLKYPAESANPTIKKLKPITLIGDKVEGAIRPYRDIAVAPHVIEQMSRHCEGPP